MAASPTLGHGAHVPSSSGSGTCTLSPRASRVCCLSARESFATARISHPQRPEVVPEYAVVEFRDTRSEVRTVAQAHSAMIALSSRSRAQGVMTTQGKGPAWRPSLAWRGVCGVQMRCGLWCGTPEVGAVRIPPYAAHSACSVTALSKESHFAIVMMANWRREFESGAMACGAIWRGIHC